MEYLLKLIKDAKSTILDPNNPEDRKIIEENTRKYKLLPVPTETRSGWRLESPYIFKEL